MVKRKGDKNTMKTNNIVVAEKDDIFNVIKSFFPDSILESDVCDNNYYHNYEETESLVMLDYSAVYINSEKNLHIVFTWYSVSELTANYLKEKQNDIQRINKLNNTIDSLKEEISELDSYNSDITERNENQCMMIDIYRENESMYNKKIDNLNETIETLYNEIESLKSENRIVSNTNERYFSYLAELNQTIKIYRDRMIESEKGKEEFTKNAVQIIDEKRKKIIELNTENDELNETISELYKRLDEKEKLDYAELYLEIDNLKKQVTEKDTLINSLYNQIHNVQYDRKCKIEEEREKYTKLFQVYLQVSDESNELENELEKMKEENEQLRKINEQLQDEKDYLQFCLDVVTNVRDNYENETCELHNKIDELNNVIDELEKENHEIFENYEKEIYEIIEKYTNEINELKDIITDNNSCYDTIEKMYIESSNELAELKEKYNVKKNVLKTYKKQNRKQRKQINELQDFNNSMQKKLYEYREKYGLL